MPFVVFRDWDSGSRLSDSGLPVLNLVPFGCDLCLAAQDLFGSVLDVLGSETWNVGTVVRSTVAGTALRSTAFNNTTLD